MTKKPAYAAAFRAGPTRLRIHHGPRPGARYLTTIVRDFKPFGVLPRRKASAGVYVILRRYQEEANIGTASRGTTGA